MNRARGRDRGSVLMLMPAGVLVVLMLGAISFDLSLVFLRQRQASSLAVDVANDVASAAVDVDAFRAGGELRIDAERASDLGAELVAVSDLAPLVLAVEVDVVAPDVVTVRVELQVDYVFARSIPGAAEGTTVTAQASAVIAPDP